MRASGTFEVKLNPQAIENNPEGSPLGRMSIDKRFSGDLSGTSHGQMLTAGTAVEGSGCYVAVERITGSLQGREGSFILHHLGIMDRGKPSLAIDVVPNSGTGQLVGLAGRMSIIIENGAHSYEFEYSLGEVSR